MTPYHPIDYMGLACMIYMLALMAKTTRGFWMTTALVVIACTIVYVFTN